MTHDLPLRCRCGAVRGVLVAYDAKASNRVTCYGDDCQAFARWLGRADVLDAHGGSDIVQVAPSRLRCTQGVSEPQVIARAERSALYCRRRRAHRKAIG